MKNTNVKYALCRDKRWGNAFLNKAGTYWTDRVDEALTFNTTNDLIQYLSHNPRCVEINRNMSIATLTIRTVEVEQIEAISLDGDSLSTKYRS